MAASIGDNSLRFWLGGYCNSEVDDRGLLPCAAQSKRASIATACRANCAGRWSMSSSDSAVGWRSVTLKALGWHGIERTLNSPKIKRKYVWTKSGGLCWYCGAQLYCQDEVDTECKRQFVFTTDHVHPRSNGGRGRANKVPACRYCNSHKSSRSVEEFRQWLQALVCEQATPARALGGEYGPRRWKINSEAVVFYFELARLLNSHLKEIATVEVTSEDPPVPV